MNLIESVKETCIFKKYFKHYKFVYDTKEKSLNIIFINVMM